MQGMARAASPSMALDAELLKNASAAVLRGISDSMGI
jgi:hypothetical protein